MNNYCKLTYVGVKTVSPPTGTLQQVLHRKPASHQHAQVRTSLRCFDFFIISSHVDDVIAITIKFSSFQYWSSYKISDSLLHYLSWPRMECGNRIWYLHQMHVNVSTILGFL